MTGAFDTPAAGPLRQRLLASGLTLKAATVLAKQIDPYRVDTPAEHRDARWFAEVLDNAIGSTRRIHLRGLHYALLGQRKPDGTTYITDAATWGWLAIPAKAARFLGYVPFTRITDARNSAPIINIREPATPESWVLAGLHVDIPDSGEPKPEVYVTGFEGRQPFHLCIFGEKSSLADVVLPIAERFDADVFLPGGEISDTLLYEMAAGGADGRPIVVFTLADCDPAGNQMPVSIGRKLQALRDLLFPDLEFEVRPIALSVEQVRELGLPSAPLKPSERRGDKWRAAYGVEQTEIDALATLRPDVLKDILADAIWPRRVAAAQRVWQANAQAALDRHVDGEMLEELRAEAAGKLGDMRAESAALNQKLNLATGDRFTLPKIEIPEPELPMPRPAPPLISSAWDWNEQVRALRSRKAFEDDGDVEGGAE